MEFTRLKRYRNGLRKMLLQDRNQRKPPTIQIASWLITEIFSVVCQAVQIYNALGLVPRCRTCFVSLTASQTHSRMVRSVWRAEPRIGGSSLSEIFAMAEIQ